MSEPTKEMKWRSFEEEQPQMYDAGSGFCFVFFPDEINRRCCAFAVATLKLRPPSAPGWYPGGRAAPGTYWIPIEEVPLPIV